MKTIAPLKLASLRKRWHRNSTGMARRRRGSIQLDGLGRPRGSWRKTRRHGPWPPGAEAGAVAGQQGRSLRVWLDGAAARTGLDFNPQTISRSRTVTIKTAMRRGAAWLLPHAVETPRAAQRRAAGESISTAILLDATDKMQEGDPIATQFGIQPQIDTLRSMLSRPGAGRQ